MQEQIRAKKGNVISDNIGNFENGAFFWHFFVFHFVHVGEKESRKSFFA